MVFPVKPVNDEPCISEECWVPVKAVQVEIAGIVVYDTVWN